MWKSVSSSIVFDNLKYNYAPSTFPFLCNVSLVRTTHPLITHPQNDPSVSSFTLKTITRCRELKERVASVSENNISVRICFVSPIQFRSTIREGKWLLSTLVAASEDKSREKQREWKILDEMLFVTDWSASWLDSATFFTESSADADHLNQSPSQN